MITIAQREYATARGPFDVSASIAVAPASLVTSRRIRPRRKGGWPLAHPLAVALDLAEDRSLWSRDPRGLDPTAGVPSCLVRNVFTWLATRLRRSCTRSPGSLQQTSVRSR